MGPPCSGVCVCSSTLRCALVCHHSFSLSSFHQPPLSLLPPVSFFYHFSQLYCPLCFCAALVSSPSLFFFPPICFLFSTVSDTALLCFSSSDPNLEHLREIRRKLASENLHLEAPVAHLLSRSQPSDRRTFGASWRLPEKGAVDGGAGLDSLCDASVSSGFPASTPSK